MPFELLAEVVVTVEEREGGLALFAEEVRDLGIGEEEKKALDGFAMKREFAGGELILFRPFLLVGGECAPFAGEFAAEGGELRFDGIGGFSRLAEVDGDFEELAIEEASFDGASFGVGDGAVFGLDFEDSKVGLITGEGNVKVHGMSFPPDYQFLRRIPPAEAEGRGEDILGLAGESQWEGGGEEGDVEKKPHGSSFGRVRRNRKLRPRRGSFLVEAAISLAVLTALGLILLKLSLNVTLPRQWTMMQSLTDSYVSFEKAYAQRISFAQLTGEDSPWPTSPTTRTTTVEIGRLPGGVPVEATVVRMKVADTNNLPSKGGTGTAVTNPAGLEVWKLISVVRYEVGERTYVKSRTVVRSQ